MSRREMEERGWDAPDILLLSGDAYVDHPSFGVALLGRMLEAEGHRVCIVAQPAWEGATAPDALRALGRPRLFAGVTAGAIDSMLAHYTAFRKKRHDDAYSPGNKAGLRPNRACIAYTGLVRRAFPGLPVVLGGIEASLRRFSHYDFWSDSLRRSILLDSKADLLLWGMGEYSLAAVARIASTLAEESGTPLDRAAFAQACRTVPGLAFAASPVAAQAWLQEGKAIIHTLPAHEAIQADAALLLRATLDAEILTHKGGRHFFQQAGERCVVVTPPPPLPLQHELDRIYALPFTRLPHPSYSESIPAWETVRASISSHRGCGGGCSFCSLALHQGRRIASRSQESLLREAAIIAKGPNGPAPRWAGSITDVSGPSANMWQAVCSLPAGKECARTSCLHPAQCPFFQVDQRKGVRMMRAMTAVEGVRHVRVAGGVRFDLALTDAEALAAYTSEFTGGQLKVAPEHSEDAVLALMRKPSLALFERFLDAFSKLSGNAGKEQYTVPYLMSAFPGCTPDHMRALCAWLKRRNWSPRQVQCFIPTPGTVATAMYYCGLSPLGEPLYVARSDKERLEQHHLLLGGKKEDKKRPWQKAPGKKLAPKNRGRSR